MTTHILIVDDNPQTRNAISFLLPFRDYEVTAVSGEHALRAVHFCKPDIVVAEIIMLAQMRHRTQSAE